MASNTREANIDDERALLTAAGEKDVKTLTSLLQKGVCPNVYDSRVFYNEKRERENVKKRERKRDYRNHKIFFREWYDSLPPVFVFGCGDDV